MATLTTLRKERIQQFTDDIAAARKRADEAKAELSRCVNARDECDRKLQQITASVGAQDNQLRRLESERQVLNSNLARATEQSQAAQAQVGNLQAEVLAKTTQVDQLQQRLRLPAAAQACAAVDEYLLYPYALRSDVPNRITAPAMQFAVIGENINEGRLSMSELLRKLLSPVNLRALIENIVHDTGMTKNAANKNAVGQNLDSFDDADFLNYLAHALQIVIVVVLSQPDFQQQQQWYMLFFGAHASASSQTFLFLLKEAAQFRIIVPVNPAQFLVKLR